VSNLTQKGMVVEMKVCAGIVLYNPDAKRLAENINAIKPQVDMLVFVDNASANIDEVRSKFADDNHIWIINETNQGIAVALNQLIDFADKNGYEWILTLDQDSICEENLVNKLLEVIKVEKNAEKESLAEKNALAERERLAEREASADNRKTAMLGPLIMDRGIADADLPPDKTLADIEDVRFCITSGCLTDVKAVADVGGFNEWLFIDEVDREICLRLLHRGYRLLRVNTVELKHEYGSKTVTRKLLWKEVIYRNYAPIRVYYQTRNLVYMMRKYGREYTPRLFYRWVRLFFAFSVKFICERDRIQRLKAFAKGLKEGLSVKI